MPKIISISKLNYAYPAEEGQAPHPALHDVSLEIEEGEFIAILGHNGCGKSTLAKHLNGILKADSGEVTVLGMNAADEERLLEIRKNVGMVFQNPDNQFVGVTVKDDIAFGLENHCIPHEQMDPLMTGGGMNVKFGLCGEVKYLDPPERFEAGTLNLEGIFAFNETLKYLTNIGMENIEKREKELRKYAISRMKENPNIIIYNENAEAGIISFNYKGVFAQDEATYLNSKGIVATIRRELGSDIAAACGQFPECLHPDCHQQCLRLTGADGCSRPHHEQCHRHAELSPQAHSDKPYKSRSGFLRGLYFPCSRSFA